jgi:lysozyme family protein
MLSIAFIPDSPPQPAYKIVIANYPHCYIAGEEVDVKTLQEAVGLTGTDVDGSVGTKTIKAVMLQNSVVDFEGAY